MTAQSPPQRPLPASPQLPSSRRASLFVPSPVRSRPQSPLSRDTSPYVRPRFNRQDTSATVRRFSADASDSFYEGSTISVNQPVGSLSISPSSRDVCLASRRGLYILDVANLNNAPRFIPQGGAWQIADCQWSPHPATSNLILSTSSQKLLVWDLSAQKCLYRSIDAHTRAITDINWHALNPNLMATVCMDASLRGWDLRDWDRPFMRVCAWGAAGTQVKWNRRHEYIVATAHGNDVLIWDYRKGSIPLTSVRAHDAKIYGIDWDRKHRHKLVTCSLDKTIKYWSIDELATSASELSNQDAYHDSVHAPEKPTHTISTSYPVWRARNLPFGEGVLALPQRGCYNLDMFGAKSDNPVETFEGHDGVVKEFVWRTRGGNDENFDDREFQLITWSRDRTLRIWPVGREVCERVGHKRGAPITVLVSRRGAPDITYTRTLDSNQEEKDKQILLQVAPPIVQPSGISKQRMMAKAETGMTRGGAVKPKGMDQLEWLAKVVRNKASPTSSNPQSRVGSVSRPPSRGDSSDVRSDNTAGNKDQYIPLKDELLLLNKLFPRPKINFEKIDLAHRKVTMSMSGPWGNGDRMAFMRIHWSFPASYPYSPDIPTFEFERNATISPISRQKIITTIKLLRAENRQCLVATCGFLLGSEERIGRRLIDEDSGSETEAETKASNVVMLIRTCGATFGPNGQLVCFFPKQTVLPRTKNISRSPSISRHDRSPLVKAMSALSRMDNPNHRNAVRLKPRLRRLDNVPAPVQSGSTMTIHDVSYLGNPSASLAESYALSLSPERNLLRAFDAKRLDHAQVWSILRGLLSDLPPPPYSAESPGDKEFELRRDRNAWERGIARKRLILDQLLEPLIAARDVQLLALISCMLLDHVNQHPPPPRPESIEHMSPEPDYFGLPRNYSSQPSSDTLNTPRRRISRPNQGPSSPSPAWNRTSGWSQILNASSFSLRNQLTPPHRLSIDAQRAQAAADPPEEASPVGLTIPLSRKSESSPRFRDRVRTSGVPSTSPTSVSALATATRYSGSSYARSSNASSIGHSVSAGTGGGGGSRFALVTSQIGSVDEAKESSPESLAFGVYNKSQGHSRSSSYSQSTSQPHGGSRVTFGPGPGASSSSPMRRTFSHRATLGTPGALSRKKALAVCAVRIELPTDDTDPPTLLDARLRAQCEGFKLAYADFLLRCGLLGIRTQLLQFEFIDSSLLTATSLTIAEAVVQSASGILPLRLHGAHEEPQRPVPSGAICVTCAAFKDCPSCHKAPLKPLCAYCRLPIKGLSATCGQCSHRTHARCYRAHFAGTSNLTCPACLCQCAISGGVTSSKIKLPPEIRQPLALEDHKKRTERSVSPGARVGRMTYASLKAIKEQDYDVSGVSSALGLQSSSDENDGTSGWLGWEGRLGWPGALGGHGNAPAGPGHGAAYPDAAGPGVENDARASGEVGERREKRGLSAAPRGVSRGGGRGK